MAEDPQRLALAFLLLAGDERDDVALHLGPIGKGLARAGDGLIRAHHHLARLELAPGRQRRRIRLDGAVGLDGDEPARGAQAGPLVLDDLVMLRIDLRHHHRHIRGPAVRGIVGDHRGFGLGVPLLQRADLVLRHVHGGEYEIHVGGHRFHILGVPHDHVLDGRRHRRLHLPPAAHGLLVGLACGMGGCGERGHLEPRMIVKQRHKTLADHTGRADDADLEFFGHISPLGSWG